MRAFILLFGAVLIVAGLEAAMSAQIPFGRGFSQRAPLASDPSGLLPDDDGGFRFCRLWFRNGFTGDGDGWFVDHPRADENLSIRLSELTMAPVTSKGEGQPAPVVVRLTDPALFRCPFIMMSEPGGSFFSPEEAASLRKYLLKGGFLWADDFWGTVAWRNWEAQIGKALSPTEFPIVDLSVDHPMFRMLFPVASVPQIPNVGLWRYERRTSERGSDSDELHVRGIADHHGRVMVLMTHNTDFGDAYERESDDPSYFRTFSITGYAIGVDVLLYAMTH